MESVKSAVQHFVTTNYGANTLELDTVDLGISLCVHAYPDYAIYIRPDDRQTKFLCHYAHRGDLEACADNSTEMSEWKQQSKFQLIRVVDGNLRRFVDVACSYVRDAVGRMELYKDVDCTGFYTRIKTFEEAKLEAQFMPKPHVNKVVLPPPVCRRHNDVHREVEKKKRKIVQRTSNTPPATIRPY